MQQEDFDGQGAPTAPQSGGSDVGVRKRNSKQIFIVVCTKFGGLNVLKVGGNITT